jgi:hypothetical protein
MPGAQLCHEIRHYVIVSPRDQLQGYALLLEGLLQVGCLLPDLSAGIMIKAWQDMRRAGDDRYAIGDKSLRHR